MIDVARLITPLSPIQKEILQILWENYHGEYTLNYIALEDMLHLGRDILKPEMDGLRALGLVRHVKGLMNEDGEVAGSGFDVVYDKRDETARFLSMGEV